MRLVFKYLNKTMHRLLKIEVGRGPKIRVYVSEHNCYAQRHSVVSLDTSMRRTTCSGPE